MRIEAHGSAYEIEATGVVARCAAAGGPYEPRLLEHIFEQSFAGTAVDVGAHVGNHTLWLAAVCDLDVVAFEPSDSFDELVHNIALNELGARVTAHRMALGANPGVAALVGKGQLKVGRGDIEIRTLDEYELSNVSVMKVDVEGMEAAVLAGATALIERDRPVIYAETWGNHFTRRVAEVLQPFGYEAASQIETATPVLEWRCR